MGKDKVNVKFVKSRQDLGNALVNKALTSNSLEDDKDGRLANTQGVIPVPYDIKQLKKIVEESSILLQCIEAYKRNIVGFGAVPEYTDDTTIDGESPELMSEWDKVNNFIKYFNFDTSFEDVLGDVIEDREITGNGYLEIIRNGEGLPVEGVRLDPEHIQLTKLSEYIDVTQPFGNTTITRKRRFRKFMQSVGTKKVYYKEYEDPRTLDVFTGEYKDDLPIEKQANEILHFKLGSDAYGIPRWIGQLIHMVGARMAEELNYRYFTQGRHTPMAILLHNAELSDESIAQLEDYAASVEGVDNSHKFLVIEAEGLDSGVIGENKENARVELKSVTDMLQDDALFLDYDDSSRKKVQSAFRLPDIYVGRSTDFNRATADTARYITEEQVFEPERNSLEWVLNNKLLAEYGIQHTKLIFKKPEISNAEEITKVLDSAQNIGALAPNDARPIIGKLLGVELESFDDPAYDLPQGQTQPIENSDPDNVQDEVIEKAYNQDDLILLLKDMRDVLNDLSGDD